MLRCRSQLVQRRLSSCGLPVYKGLLATCQHRNLSVPCDSKSKMEVHVIPMLKDNLGYLVQCTATGASCFVDISYSSAPVFIRALERHRALVPGLVVLTTHKHKDHAGGNVEARAEFERLTGSPLRVYGDAVIDCSPGVTDAVVDGDSLSIGSLCIRVLATPCHTKGSLCFYVTAPGPGPGALFTGDTLFVGGVGAFFEGSSSAMVPNLLRLAALPPETLVWPGHDYALTFLPNACALDRHNAALPPRLAWAQRCRDAGVPAVPSTIRAEIETNLYVRAALGGDAAASVGALFPASASQPGAAPPAAAAALMDLVYAAV
jgi:hydroxyacylglutathione hydrolase